MFFTKFKYFTFYKIFDTKYGYVKVNLPSQATAIRSFSTLRSGESLNNTINYKNI
jgi:hypothetical protein